MRTTARGLAMLVAAVVGIVVTIIDGADDGFSIWNAIGLVCFAIVGLYGIAALSSRPPS
jgi:hypothetical protein